MGVCVAPTQKECAALGSHIRHDSRKPGSSQKQMHGINDGIGQLQPSPDWHVARNEEPPGIGVRRRIVPSRGYAKACAEDLSASAQGDDMSIFAAVRSSESVTGMGQRTVRPESLHEARASERGLHCDLEIWPSGLNNTTVDIQYVDIAQGLQAQPANHFTWRVSCNSHRCLP